MWQAAPPRRSLDATRCGRSPWAHRCGPLTSDPGWIQRRWRVRFDTGKTVDVPEYALELCHGRGRFRRAT
jgi:hypothetical protein